MSGSDRSVLWQDAWDTLSRWAAPDPRQAALREDYLRHLDAYPDGLWRTGPPAHLTASCFVLDPSGTHTLLTLHRKGGFWVQFGGHLEHDDTSLRAAALREAREESGLGSGTTGPHDAGDDPEAMIGPDGDGEHSRPVATDIRRAEGGSRPEPGSPTGLRLLSDLPIDLDRHALSSSFGRCREHLDVAYLAVASRGETVLVSDESDDVAWWPLGALPDGVVADLPPRLARAAAAVRTLAGASPLVPTAHRPDSSV